jgi:dipeptidyl-peptidase-4
MKNKWFVFIAAMLIAVLSLPLLAQEIEFKKYTFDDAMGGSGMRYGGVRVTWMPDGKSLLYTERVDGESFYVQHDLASGKKTQTFSETELQKKLKEMVKARPRAVMSDVNLAGRVNYVRADYNADMSLMISSHNSDLYIVDTTNGDVEFLTDDADEEIWPLFSPDSSKVAFARQRDIYMLDVATKDIKRLTDRGDNTLIYNGVADWVYDEEFGLNRSFWWSPDNTKLAFIQFDTAAEHTFPIVDHLEVNAVLEEQQYPKPGNPNATVKLGVIDVATGDIKWIATGKDEDSYIVRVGWLPDGSKLWYQWVDRDQTTIELTAADPTTGETSLILKDHDPRWIEVRGDFRFIDDNSFIWTSEKDGWRHIYRHTLDGKEFQITKGDWQVQSVAGFDSNKEYIYFTSTEVSPMEMHYYRIKLDGTGKEHLSDFGTWNSINKAPVGDYYIGSHQDLKTPSWSNIYHADGKKLSEWTTSAKVPMLKDHKVSWTTYNKVKSEDGTTDLYYSMVLPHDYDASKQYPVYISIYGGPNSQAVTKRFSFSTSTQYFAQEGIITLRVDNRGTNARGRDFKKIVHRNLGHYEVVDHVTVLKHLAAEGIIDAKRVAISGGSYGGYMTLMGLLMAPDYIQFGVAGSSVTDWRFYDTIYTERYMDTPQTNPEGYKISAPINHAANFKGELLITHGTMDNNVHAQNTYWMVDELIRADKDFSLMVYPRERHGIRTAYRRHHVSRTRLEFLLKHLLSK